MKKIPSLLENYISLSLLFAWYKKGSRFKTCSTFIHFHYFKWTQESQVDFRFAATSLCNLRSLHLLHRKEEIECQWQPSQRCNQDSSIFSLCNPSLSAISLPVTSSRLVLIFLSRAGLLNNQSCNIGQASRWFRHLLDAYDLSQQQNWLHKHLQLLLFCLL